MTTPPAISENPKRILAWLDNHPKAIMILHAARRRAKEYGCRWCVAYVETPARLDDEMSQHMLRLCTLAEQMGGEVLHVRADTVQKGLSTLLESEKERIALFVVGSNDARTGLGRLRLRPTPWEEAVRQAGHFTRVEIVPLASTPVSKIRWNLNIQNIQQIRPMRFAYALAAVSVAFVAAKILEWSLPPALFRVNMQNVSLLFMTACAFVAGRYGLLPGLVAAIGSFLTYNYFYMAPSYLFKVTSVTQALNMAIFLFAGALIAIFTSRVRERGEMVARRERATQALFTLYRIASTAFSRQQVLETLQRKLSQMMNIEVAFFLPPTLNPESIEAAMPADLELDNVDRRALMTCWSEMKTTGMASPLHTHASWRFEPMIAPGGEIGVLAARPKSGNLDVWLGSLLNNIADQTAVLIEHIEMERTMEANRLSEEREKLRSMLLSSVSHDLKTPLAGIIGGLSVYLSVGDRLAASKRQELVTSAFEEAQRLDSFITNILDMTRLESGKIDFRPEWYDMGIVIAQVSKRVQYRLHHRKLTIHECPQGIETYMDVMMIGQVLQNLIDNACKYTPDGTQIDISCHVTDAQQFICKVRDHGPGIPDDKLTRVFDKYARLQKEDSQVAGTGLGLAICKAIIEAQGGWIAAANHPQGGAEFTFCLPQSRDTRLKPNQEEVA